MVKSTILALVLVISLPAMSSSFFSGKLGVSCNVSLLKVTDSAKVVDGEVFSLSGQADDFSKNFIEIYDTTTYQDYELTLLFFPAQINEQANDALGESLLLLDARMFYKDENLVTGMDGSFYSRATYIKSEAGNNYSYSPFSVENLFAIEETVTFPIQHLINNDGISSKYVGHQEFFGDFVKRIKTLRDAQNVVSGDVVGLQVGQCTFSKDNPSSQKIKDSIWSR